GAEDVPEVLRDLQPCFGRVQDGKQPQVPGDHESRELVESELGPLIQAAFERHRAIEVNDDGRGWQIEEQDRRQPERHMRRPLFRRDADPWQSDDEQDLCQREINETEILAQIRAARIDRRRGPRVGAHRCHRCDAEYTRLRRFAATARQADPPLGGYGGQAVRQPATGNWQLATGNWQLATGNRNYLIA